MTKSHGEIAHELVRLVRDRIGPVAACKTTLVVGREPKTRSGKILRGTVRAIANGRDWKMPATIDAPAILVEIAAALCSAGHPCEAAMAEAPEMPVEDET
jgi:propionyl-CoA synthetase